MNSMIASKTAAIDVPVLIVGGGGAGLTCSMLLSQLGIGNLLVSALPTTSILPKAHVLNQRTMEILDDVGVAEPIYARSTPAENMSAMGWYAGFAGPDPDMGRQIAKIKSWGCGYTNLNWMQASPCRSANLPQIRLEPIMKARAEELAPGMIRFHHELTRLEQDSEGVSAGSPTTARRGHRRAALPAREKGRTHAPPAAPPPHKTEKHQPHPHPPPPLIPSWRTTRTS